MKTLTIIINEKETEMETQEAQVMFGKVVSGPHILCGAMEVAQNQFGYKLNRSWADYYENGYAILVSDWGQPYISDATAL